MVEYRVERVGLSRTLSDQVRLFDKHTIMLKRMNYRAKRIPR